MSLPPAAAAAATAGGGGPSAPAPAHASAAAAHASASPSEAHAAAPDHNGPTAGPPLLGASLAFAVRSRARTLAAAVTDATLPVTKAELDQIIQFYGDDAALLILQVLLEETQFALGPEVPGCKVRLLYELLLQQSRLPSFAGIISRTFNAAPVQGNPGFFRQFCEQLRLPLEQQVLLALGVCRSPVGLLRRQGLAFLTRLPKDAPVLHHHPLTPSTLRQLCHFVLACPSPAPPAAGAQQQASQPAPAPAGGGRKGQQQSQAAAQAQAQAHSESSADLPLDPSEREVPVEGISHGQRLRFAQTIAQAYAEVLARDPGLAGLLRTMEQVSQAPGAGPHHHNQVAVDPRAVSSVEELITRLAAARAAHANPESAGAAEALAAVPRLCDVLRCVGYASTASPRVFAAVISAWYGCAVGPAGQGQASAAAQAQSPAEKAASASAWELTPLQVAECVAVLLSTASNLVETSGPAHGSSGSSASANAAAPNEDDYLPQPAPLPGSAKPVLDFLGKLANSGDAQLASQLLSGSNNHAGYANWDLKVFVQALQPAVRDWDAVFLRLDLPELAVFSSRPAGVLANGQPVQPSLPQKQFNMLCELYDQAKQQQIKQQLKDDAKSSSSSSSGGSGAGASQPPAGGVFAFPFVFLLGRPTHPLQQQHPESASAAWDPVPLRQELAAEAQQFQAAVQAEAKENEASPPVVPRPASSARIAVGAWVHTQTQLRLLEVALAPENRAKLDWVLGEPLLRLQPFLGELGVIAWPTADGSDAAGSASAAASAAANKKKKQSNKQRGAQPPPAPPVQSLIPEDTRYTLTTLGALGSTTAASNSGGKDGKATANAAGSNAATGANQPGQLWDLPWRSLALVELLLDLYSHSACFPSAAGILFRGLRQCPATVSCSLVAAAPRNARNTLRSQIVNALLPVYLTRGGEGLLVPPAGREPRLGDDLVGRVIAELSSSCCAAGGLQQQQLAQLLDTLDLYPARPVPGHLLPKGHAAVLLELRQRRETGDAPHVVQRLWQSNAGLILVDWMLRLHEQDRGLLLRAAGLLLRTQVPLGEFLRRSVIPTKSLPLPLVLDMFTAFVAQTAALKAEDEARYQEVSRALALAIAQLGSWYEEQLQACQVDSLSMLANAAAAGGAAATAGGHPPPLKTPAYMFVDATLGCLEQNLRRADGPALAFQLPVMIVAVLVKALDTHAAKLAADLAQRYQQLRATLVSPASYGKQLQTLLEQQQLLIGQASNDAAGTGAGTGAGGAEEPQSPLLANQARQGATEIEIEAQRRFQQIFKRQLSLPQTLEMFRQLKAAFAAAAAAQQSPAPKDAQAQTQAQSDAQQAQLYSCMIHTLFDEYKFLHTYPPQELQISGVVFGQLLQHKLLPSGQARDALRLVLEALRNTIAAERKMCVWGICALRQFQPRLQEWPQYCSLLLKIPYVRDRPEHADIVAYMQEVINARTGAGAGGQAKAESSERGGSSSTTAGGAKSVSSSSSSGSGVAPEQPSESVRDQLHFILNSITANTLHEKVAELAGTLVPAHYNYFARFLVLKRVTTESNFHAVYQAMLDRSANKALYREVLLVTYDAIRNLLASQKVLQSMSDRAQLKNLGSWLGMLTLAKNRPVLRRHLDLKQLLITSYHQDRLVAAVPLVCRIMAHCEHSKVFHLPNPWVASLFALLREISLLPDIKLNLKFEIERLVSELQLNIYEIEPSQLLLSAQQRSANAAAAAAGSGGAPAVTDSSAHSGSKQPSSGKQPSGSAGQQSQLTLAQQAVAAVSTSDLLSPEANSQALAGDRGGSGGPLPLTSTIIPKLHNYISINPQIHLFSLFPQLKRCVPLAVDRAIREIIAPVVERSVNIACVTTRELVTKDFAGDGDERKMRMAAHHMVKALTSSLALVTCKDTLRLRITSNLAQLLAAHGGANLDHASIEAACHMVAKDNLDLGCALIEKAAADRAVREIDETLARHFAVRRKHREQTGGAQAFADPAFLGPNAPAHKLPEALRPQLGGLLPAQLQVYENFSLLQTPSLGGTGSYPGAPAAGSVGPGQTAVPTGGTPLSQGAAGPLGVPPQGPGQAGGLGLVAAGGPEDKAASKLAAQSLLNRLRQCLNTLENLAARIPKHAEQSLHQVVPLGDYPYGPHMQIQRRAAPVSAGDGSDAQAQAAAQAAGALQAIMVMVPRPTVEDNTAEAEILRYLTTVAQTLQQLQRHEPALASEITFAFAHEVFKYLYEPATRSSRLQIDLHVYVLGLCRRAAPQLAKEITDWLLTAEDQRVFLMEITLALFRQHVLVVAEVDVFFAKLIDSVHASGQAVVAGQPPQGGAKTGPVATLHPRLDYVLSLMRRLVVKESLPGGVVRPNEFALVFEVLAKMAQVNKTLTGTLTAFLQEIQQAFGLHQQHSRQLQQLHAAGAAAAVSGGAGVAGVGVGQAGQAAMVGVGATGGHLAGQSAAAVALPASAAALAAAVGGASLGRFDELAHSPLVNLGMGVGPAGNARGALLPGFQAIGMLSGLEETTDVQRLERELFDDTEIPGLRDQIVYLLDDWMNICLQLAPPDDVYAKYLQILQQQRILATPQSTARFFRIITQLCIHSAFHAQQKQAEADAEAAASGSGAGANAGDKASAAAAAAELSYTAVDALSKLVVFLVKFLDPEAGQPVAPPAAGTNPAEERERLAQARKLTKLRLLASFLNTSALVVRRDFDRKGVHFNPRPYLRLYSNLLQDLNTPDPGLDSNNVQVLMAFANCFHLLRPERVPSFAVCWMELIAHRMFMSKLLLSRHPECAAVYFRLLADLLRFLYPYLHNAELAPGVRMLYMGCLRLLLVLLHDFPGFLCQYHFAFCDIIPSTCMQLRNLVLSAFPRSMRLPDPFTAELRIRDIPEIRGAPQLAAAAVARQQRVLLRWLDPAWLEQLQAFLDNGGVVPGEQLAGAQWVQQVFLPRLRLPGGAGDDNTAGSAAGDGNKEAGANAAGAFDDGSEDARELRRRYACDWNVPLINALVLYLGVQGIKHQVQLPPGAVPDSDADGNPSQASSYGSYEDAYGLLFREVAAQLDPEGRYYWLNAMVNHLRYPNTHTLYFSGLLLHLFQSAGGLAVSVKEQVTRVLVERLIVHRPHPWGLLVTFMELIRNPQYQFWAQPFTKCAPQIERLFESVARSCIGVAPPGSGSGSPASAVGVVQGMAPQ